MAVTQEVDLEPTVRAEGIEGDRGHLEQRGTCAKAWTRHSDLSAAFPFSLLLSLCAPLPGGPPARAVFSQTPLIPQALPDSPDCGENLLLPFNYLSTSFEYFILSH